MNAAIVAAAGWKGAGWQVGLARFPVAFLPLGNRATPLSRLATQLERLDFKVHIGMGKRGYPYGAYQPRQIHGLAEDDELKPIEEVLEMMSLSMRDSPWTQELYDYASQFGAVVEMEDPGWSNQHDTFCGVMDAIGADWDCLLLVCGDTLFSSDLLAEVVNLPRPCQYQMCPNHAVFLLDRATAPSYREYAGTHRTRWKSPKEKPARTARYPDGAKGITVLSQHGIAHHGPHDGLSCEGRWRDIDDSNDLLEIRNEIEMGRFEEVAPDPVLATLGTLEELSTLDDEEMALRGMVYNPSIYDANWFQGQGWQHPWCQKLLGWFVGEFGPFESSLDLGAGDGYYSYVLWEMGTEVVAVEVSEEAMPVIPEPVSSIVHDLRDPLDMLRTYELIICLEVAEHLPEENADTLCNTIARHCGRMLLFTAAPPGQGGHGHCNLQPFEYWREKLESRGLRFCTESTERAKRAWGNILRKSLPWLTRNVSIFVKESEEDGDGNGDNRCE